MTRRLAHLAIILVAVLAVCSANAVIAHAQEPPPTKPPPGAEPPQPTKPPAPTQEPLPTKPPPPVEPPSSPPTQPPAPAPTRPLSQPTQPPVQATPTNTRRPGRVTPTSTDTSTSTPNSASTSPPTPAPASTSTPMPSATPTATPTLAASLLSTFLVEPPLWLIILVAGGLATLITAGGPRLREFANQRILYQGATAQLTEEAMAMSLVAQSKLGAAAEEASTLPALFIAEGARIMVNGPPRSGKSTLLHNLLQRALRDPSFTVRVLLDGKGSNLAPYAQLSNVTYRDAAELADWPDVLRGIARDLPARYQHLMGSGKRKADLGDPRVLIVVDDIYSAIRDQDFGSEIAEAMLLIAEQPGGLADVLIFTTQQVEQHAAARDATFNANVVITLRSTSTPGAFTIKSSLAGPVEAAGQARYADNDNISAAISALVKG